MPWDDSSLFLFSCLLLVFILVPSCLQIFLHHCLHSVFSFYFFLYSSGSQTLFYFQRTQDFPFSTLIFPLTLSSTKDIGLSLYFAFPSNLFSVFSPFIFSTSHLLPLVEYSQHGCNLKCFLIQLSSLFNLQTQTKTPTQQTIHLTQQQILEDASLSFSLHLLPSLISIGGW